MYADVQKPVPHKTAATGEEYAVSTKATKPGKGKPQGPTEEYAQIDKSKKSGQQGVSMYTVTICKKMIILILLYTCERFKQNPNFISFKQI